MDDMIPEVTTAEFLEAIKTCRSWQMMWNLYRDSIVLVVLDEDFHVRKMRSPNIIAMSDLGWEIFYRSIWNIAEKRSQGVK